MSDPQQQSPAASSSTSAVAKTHYLQQQSSSILTNPLIDSSSSTSLLIGTSTADLLLDEHQLGLHGSGNERVETLGGQIDGRADVASSSQWAFNNLFHQMGHQSFSNEQINPNYEHATIGQQHTMCNSGANAYSTSTSHYFNYTLNNEFTDANSYSTGAGQNFFPSNVQLPYGLPYDSNSTQSIAKNPSLQNETNEDGTEDSTYSANSSADSSRSPSTDSSRKENPSFYSETKPTTLFGSNSTTPSNFHQRSPFEPFCVVPGRMSLLSSTTKYKVTIGEIQRRISPPECLNASLLGGILRKAKSKDGGKALREALRRIGLTLPAGRRKSAHVTALTALVEEEAVHMAKDFHSVCERDFPSKEIAHFLSRHVNNDEEAHQRRTMLHYVRMHIKELSDLLNADRSPICATRPDVILDPSIQKPLTHFSMVSHGFGGLVFLSVLDALNNCVHESIKHLDRNFNTNRQNPYVFPS